MSSITNLRTLNSYYYLMLNAYQSFSMCLYDIDLINEGMFIGYSIDGYDFCRYIFPSDFFIGKDNPHHKTIQDTWDNFFEKSDGKTIYAIISPFTTLEIYATIIDTVKSFKAYDYFIKKKEELMPILDAIKKNAKAFKRLPKKQKDVVRNFDELLKIERKARQILYSGDAFKKTKALMDQDKIKPLDSLIQKYYSGSSTSLFDFNKENINRALDYLSNKRIDRYSKFSDFYNALDVYHYVMFDNINKYAKQQNTKAYLSSSGIISRNSWFLTKYGHLAHDLQNIPKNWMARSSDTPTKLLNALSWLNNDYESVRDFFEEGRSFARIILRDFKSIDVLSEFLGSDSKKRNKMIEENHEVKVDNRISEDLIRFQNEYYNNVEIKFDARFDVPVRDDEYDIDFNELHRWVKNPQNRAEQFPKLARKINSAVNMLNLAPINWNDYISPLGETSYDVLKIFDANLDI